MYVVCESLDNKTVIKIIIRNRCLFWYAMDGHRPSRLRLALSASLAVCCIAALALSIASGSAEKDGEIATTLLSKWGALEAPLSPKASKTPSWTALKQDEGDVSKRLGTSFTNIQVRGFFVSSMTRLSCRCAFEGRAGSRTEGPGLVVFF